MCDRECLIVNGRHFPPPKLGRKLSSSFSGDSCGGAPDLRSTTSHPTVRATMSAFSSWQLGLPDSRSTMKRSPVPERAASCACVQPSALRLSLTKAPKSRADRIIVILLYGLTVQEVLRWHKTILTDREA